MLYTPLARVLKAQRSVIPERYGLKVYIHTTETHQGMHTEYIDQGRCYLMAKATAAPCSHQQRWGRERSQSAEERARARVRTYRDMIERELKWRDVDV